MTIALMTFTENGFRFAQRAASVIGGSVTRCGAELSLRDWTAQQFAASDALIFVGAAGIAVRAIAPHVVSKTTDPAVLVMDECGNYVIPILSGHLGGANDLAQAIHAACGAQPVLTTATDVRGVFAVDEWAKRQNCAVVNPERIKRASAAVLRGERIPVYSHWRIAGACPDCISLVDDPSQAMVCLSAKRENTDALLLAPRVLTLGIGCRKGISCAALETGFAEFCEQTGVLEQAICGVSTITLKQNEPGLREFCTAHGWTLHAMSAEALAQTDGTFTASPFVQTVTGVDNVCERSAVFVSGGTLMQTKWISHGATFALACAPYHPDWRWKHE